MIEEGTKSSFQVTTKIPFQTRSVSPKDLLELPPIFNHYIAHSVISFRLEPIDIDFFEGLLKTTYAHELPFIVATTTPTPPITESEDLKEIVIGYAYATPWRPNYAAYRHTVEISIYVNPQYVSAGAGSALMDGLMAALRTTRVRDPTTENFIRNDVNLEQSNGPGSIHQVLVIMSLDPEGKEGGLEKFYARWGFERIGHMKRVGYKFGRWIDVLMLQVSL
jgi:phosphinothricin acetyltransferase